MKTLVVGANGKIGRILLARLAAAGQPVRAMVRGPDQRAALEALGAEVVEADLEADFSYALDGVEALVFTAGSGAHTGADKTLLVDLWGAVKTIRLCEKNGIRRYLMISSRNAGDPDTGPASRRHYLVAKHMADKTLMQSSLDYTILRPGRLTDDAGSGSVTTQRPGEEAAQSIPREDVAEAITVCLARQETIGRVVQLYQGEVPIAEALVGEG